MTKSFFFLLNSLLTTTVLTAEVLLWDSHNRFQGWKAQENVSCQFQSGHLVLTDIRPDSQIILRGLSLDPGKYNRFSFRYRAVDVGPLPGQLFFAQAGRPFSERQVWRIPGLKNDGQWHTVTLTEKNLLHPRNWFDNGLIASLRLDPTDSPGKKIEFSEIRFWHQPPAPTSNILIWDKSNQFKGWEAQENINCQIVDGILTLTNIGKDSQIINRNVDFASSDFNRFSFRYRARKTGRAPGQLFFAGPKQGLNDKRRWNIPALNNDGQWHAMTLASKNIADSSLWTQTGRITMLRLDPTDSPGGILEISEIRLWKSDQPDRPDPPLLWNSSNSFKGWKELANAKIAVKQGNLVMTEIKSDPQLICSDLSINPMKYNRFSFRYRASGNRWLGGQLYYANKDGGFSDRRCWKIPRLVTDGQWHRIILKEKDIHNAASWFKGGTVSRLRFDPTDNKGGEVEISEIRLYLEEPLAKLLPPLPTTTPILDAPVWPEVRPELVTRPVKIDDEPYFQGKMIESPKDPHSESTHTFFLRKTIRLKSAPAAAWLQFTADDASTAYVNGQAIGKSHNWSITAVENATDALKAGNNSLCFQYLNTFGPGGLIAELFVRYPDGSFERFDTDQTWKSLDEAPDNWTSVHFNDSSWNPVTVHPAPPNRPWTTKLHYINFQNPQKFLGSSAQPSSAVAGTPILLTYEFQGACPDRPVNAKLTLVKGNSVLWEEPVCFSKKQFIPTKNGCWKIEFSYILPLYVNNAEVKARLTCGGFFLQHGQPPESTFTIRRLETVPGFSKPVTAKMTTVDGYPMFSVNGAPFYPIWGSIYARARPDQQPKISDAPFNLITVFSDLRTAWPQCEVFDPTPFDRAAESYRRQNPDAWFIWDLSLNPPRDWKKKYPNEICRDDHGMPNQETGKVNYSFASLQARNDMEKMLIKSIRYLEGSPYAHRIIGYRVNGGHTIEWLGWDPQPGRILDFSPAARRGFKTFAQHHYPKLKDYTIPSLHSRQQLDNDEILWDPQKHLNVIAYHDFYSQTIADMMIHLCGKARETVRNRKLIGTYYGYTVTLHQTGNSQMRAHYALKKVLDSKAVDFLISPPAYCVRNIGDTCADMKPFSSLSANGILPVVEDDSRTHNGPYIYYSANFQTMTKAATLAALRRNMGMALCRNAPVYYYAMSAGTDFDFPEMELDTALERTTAEHCLKKGTPRNTEIAIVISEESIKSMPMLQKSTPNGCQIQVYDNHGKVHRINDFDKPFTGASFRGNITRYARLGAPADYMLAEDLKDHPGNYKLYIFANCISYDKEFLNAICKLKQKKCTLLWVYAPGYVHDRQSNTDNMKLLTGFPLQKASCPMMPAVKLPQGSWLGTTTTRIAPLFHVLPQKGIHCAGTYEDGTIGLAFMKNGPSTSVFCGPYQFNVPFLTALARQAGVHIYTDGSDPMEANTRLFSLHARFPGPKKIKMPRKGDILDIFNRKIIAENTDTFTFNAPLHSSWLFYIGDDARDLLAKLNHDSRKLRMQK